MEGRQNTPRCQSCRWWDRSNNFRAIGRDWGLCHFWGGKSGHRMRDGFIDYSFGHEPLGCDTCEWHNADPSKKAEAQIAGAMPEIKCEGHIMPARKRRPGMGDCAADQFARDTGMSFSDAYESLYGEDRPAKPRCPLCGRKSSSNKGVLMHLKSGSHKPTEKLSRFIAEYEASHG